MNPIATFQMMDGRCIRVELQPELAPNTVNSFIHLAGLGVYDGFAIERIVPGSWVDLSYKAFGREEAKYFLDNEAKIQGGPMISYGMMCMGGYGDNEIAGGEVYFPLRDCPDLVGKYPIIGKLLEGGELLREFEAVETYPVTIPSLPQVEINTPVVPIVIKRVTVETFGITYPAPKRKAAEPLPETWG